ncbi:Protein of unknown function [Gryllus bimaculatus]|nr:Protein of unknown function [Gryllus bimaculatus]
MYANELVRSAIPLRWTRNRVPDCRTDLPDIGTGYGVRTLGHTRGQQVAPRGQQGCGDETRGSASRNSLGGRLPGPISTSSPPSKKLLATDMDSNIGQRRPGRKF